MAIITIDGYMLRKAFIAGANELEKNKDYVDSLNVFPVPDGDTGINMSLTTIAAAKEVAKLNTPNIYDIAKAASNGSLRGARGNSGVILSQLFRGFAKGLEGKEVATAAEIADAFLLGAQTAYKAVMKPKEGTILTVAKAFAEYCIESAYDTDDIELMLREGIAHALRVLDKTVDMLPELKQANVVDAGGRGLLYIIEGAFASRNIEGEITLNDPSASKTIQNGLTPATTQSNVDIKFIYCTEFFINIDKVTDEMEDSLKKYLNTMGDSIVVVADEDIIKVHVHTNHPGSVLERALTMGTLDNMKIENMKFQHNNLINFAQTTATEVKAAPPAPPMEHKENSFVTVAAGEGISSMFKELGTDVIIEGGQSMNPSTEDILDAINKVDADNIFVLPNNKNIILAAEQAAVLSDKNVYVIPTKSIPQGVSAIVSFVPGFSVENNMASMTEAIENVKTGMVTFAVRASSYDDMEINDGDILGMLESKISIVATGVPEATKLMIDKLFEDGGGDVLSIYYGENVTEEEANEIAAYAEENYPTCESAVMHGGQPLYYYILSLE